jgi:hypothetical protein
VKLLQDAPLAVRVAREHFDARGKKPPGVPHTCQEASQVIHHLLAAWVLAHWARRRDVLEIRRAHVREDVVGAPGGAGSSDASPLAGILTILVNVCQVGPECALQKSHTRVEEFSDICRFLLSPPPIRSSPKKYFVYA